MVQGFGVDRGGAVDRRHLILPEVGLAGQKKIKATSVLCIGAGGLGSPIAMYLAAAGIGKIGIVDFDSVDFSNLQRQIAHGTEDVGRPKAVSAKETINSINPNVEVVIHNTRISASRSRCISSRRARACSTIASLAAMSRSWRRGRSHCSGTDTTRETMFE